MKRRWWVVLLAGSVLLAGCGRKASESAGAEAAAVAVRAGQVEARSHMRGQWLPGTVHPSDQAVVAAKLMATVAEAEFTIGQRVEAGDVLVVLAADEIEAQVEHARAGLAQIERNLERERALLAQSATTAEAVRTLEDQLRMARARLSEALTMDSYKLIRAPFAGTITSKLIRRGDLATPGTPLLTLDGVGPLQAYVQVPDSMSALSDGAMVVVEADGRRMDARLSEWSPAADPASRTRLAKLDLPEGSLARSGQYVRVHWPAGEAVSLWMPAAALSPMGQMQRVFAVDDGRARLRLVKAGAREGDWLQLLAGLREGEVLVLSPAAGLRDGQPVQVQP